MQKETKNLKNLNFIFQIPSSKANVKLNSVENNILLNYFVTIINGIIFVITGIAFCSQSWLFGKLFVCYKQQQKEVKERNGRDNFHTLF